MLFNSLFSNSQTCGILSKNSPTIYSQPSTDFNLNNYENIVINLKIHVVRKSDGTNAFDINEGSILQTLNNYLILRKHT